MLKHGIDAFHLKIIAISAMLIDHIGAVFFPNTVGLRLIGRLTMPIMTYLIAEGFHHTSNRRRYLTRLLIFAVASQLPFMLAFSTSTLNVLFTLAIAVLILIIQTSDINIYVKTSLSVLLITLSLWCDWNYIGALFVLVFYKYRGNFKYQSLAFVLIVALLQFTSNNRIVLGTLASLPLLYLYNGKRGRGIKYFFYAFYPFHLLALYLISYFV